MRQQYKATVRKLLILLMVPTVSLCVTFLILYFLKPIQLNLTTTNTSTHTPNDAASANVPAVAFSAPIKLHIEPINVVSDIYPVGLTLDGDMDITDDPALTAWYKLGPKPGEKGSSVIAGHYGWKNGEASIFNDLHKLTKGDEVAVLTESGQKVIFIVSHSEVYAPNQDATNVFRSNDGKAHLNLITCQGEWNSKLSTYTERLVVFTNYSRQESVLQQE